MPRLDIENLDLFSNDVTVNSVSVNSSGTSQTARRSSGGRATSPRYQLKMGDFDTRKRCMVRNSCAAIIQNELESVLEPGEAGNRPRDAAEEFLAKMAAGGDRFRPWLELDKFLEPWRQGDFVDYRRRHGTIRSAKRRQKSANKRAARMEKVREASTDEFDEFRYASRGCSMSEDERRRVFALSAPDDGRFSLAETEEEREEVRSQYRVEGQRLIREVTCDDDVETMIVSHPDVAEYFEIELREGFQSITVLVECEESGKRHIISTFSREVRSERAKAVLKRQFGDVLAAAAVTGVFPEFE